MSSLRDLILKASEVIDPYHQAISWPDPIAWDGRPLNEQARDLAVLLKSLADDIRPMGGGEEAARLESLADDLVTAARNAVGT